MNQDKSTHHTIGHFGSVKYAALVDPVEEKWKWQIVLYLLLLFRTKNSFFKTMTQLAVVTTVKNHRMTLLWDRLCLLQENFITMKAVKAY